MTPITRIIFFCSLYVASYAQATPAPRLVVDEPFFNFGKQSNDQIIEHTFQIRNDGDLSLEIKNIYSSCGCTVGAVTKRLLHPGESSDITAKLNLRGRRGSQRVTLRVETNDPQQRFTVLTMRGEATQELDIQPSSLFAADLIPGQEKRWTVNISGQATQPFIIHRIETSTAWLSAQANGESGVHEHALVVLALAPAEEGPHESLLLVYTDHPRFPKLEIPVIIHVAGPITVVPRQITIMAGNDAPITRHVVLRAGQVDAFEILEVIPPDEQIVVQVHHTPNQGYRLQLSNLRPSPALANAKLKIRTNIEGAPLIEIPFEIIPERE